MAWINTTLDQIMPETLASAAESIEVAQEALTTARTYLNKANNEVNAVLNTLTITKDKISAGGVAGFYFITLSAGHGSWNTRLDRALNSPTNSGFSAGFATIVIAPNIDAVANAASAVVKSLTTPFNLPSILTTKDPSSGYVPIVPSISLDSLDLPEETSRSTDVWESKTAGGVFTGALKGLVEDNNLMVKQARSVVNLTNQVGQKAASIQKGLTAANSFISQAGGTGVYNIILEPGPGGYLSRLESEIGAPPIDSELYSAGVVCIAEVTGEADLSSLTEQFAALQKLMPV
jgi:hypothetical protein